jgi:hypothetical protein
MLSLSFTLFLSCDIYLFSYLFSRDFFKNFILQFLILLIFKFFQL